MPEEQTTTTEPGNKPDEGKTFTQADLDRIVADRLKRAESKYSDYDDLKASAAKLAEIEAANKSETDKLREENDALKATNAKNESEALRARTALAKGLTAAQAKRLVGSTQEELEADADEILEAFPAAGGAKPPPSLKPSTNLRGGTEPEQPGEETNPAKLAADLPRY